MFNSFRSNAWGKNKNRVIIFLLVIVITIQIALLLKPGEQETLSKPLIDQALWHKAPPAVPGNPNSAPDVRVSSEGGTEVFMAVHPDGPIYLSYVCGSRCCFVMSPDGGETWEKEWRLDPQSGGITGDGVVAVDDAGNFYGVCQDYSRSEIRLTVSKDAGKTWSEWESVQDARDKPWVAATEDGKVYLSWLGGGFKRSLDHGETWIDDISLSQVGHGTAFAVGTNGILHMPYNSGSGQRYMRYMRSDDYGKTWDDYRDLATMGTPCFGCGPRSHPITGSGSDPTGQIVAITWAATLSGGDGDDDVWVIISRDGGDTWTDPIRANDNTQRSRQFQPWAAVDKWGRVHVVWTDMRHDGLNAIYYANTLDDEFGENMELTDERGTFRGFYGDYKGIAIDGDDVLFSWTDSRDGGHLIYFTREEGLAGIPPGVSVEEKGPALKPRATSGDVYNVKGSRVGTVKEGKLQGASKKAPGKYLVKEKN